MLSPHNSFISMKWPAFIFSTSRFGIGGRAGDNTRAWLVTRMGVGIGVLRSVAMDCVVSPHSLGTTLDKVGAIATDWRLAGGGMTPSPAVPAREPRERSVNSVHSRI